MESVTEYLESGYVHCGVTNRFGRLETLLEYRGRPERCCGCASTRLHSHGWRERRLSHVPLGWQGIELRIRYLRFRCSACRRVQPVKLPLLEPRARITAQLCQYIHTTIVRLQCAVESLRSQLGLGWHTVMRCLRTAPRGLDIATAEDLRHLCVDEVFFRAEHRFLTALSTSSGLVLDMCEGRGHAPTKALLEQLSEAQRDAVETLATDLNSGQRKAAYEMLDNALVCADHFHVARLIRRWLRKVDIRELPRCRRAARELRAILKYGTVDGLQDWLERWGQLRLPGSLYDTIVRWQIEIESFIETERTTGPAEALNRRIAYLRRTACGYTKLENFIKRIFWLNHPAHH